MLVILIGFVYPGNRSGHRELIGNYVDLYYLYHYFSKLTDRIIVMTDLSSPKESSTLMDAVSQNILREELLTFDRSLSWKKQIRIYQERKDLEDLLSEKDKEIFLYFSGHCSQGKILLPDSVLGMDSLQFRQKLEIDNAGSEIFLMFDCCDADGTKLPFVWEKEEYVLSKPAHFTTKKTLCLCSTRPNEDSASKITGSVFTQCFLNQIRNRTTETELCHLVNNINLECNCYQQTATLYSSFPNLKKIWSWLYKRKDDKLDHSYE